MGAAANYRRSIMAVAVQINYLRNGNFAQYETGWGYGGVAFNGQNATFSQGGQIFQRIDGGTLPPGQYKLVVTGTGNFHVKLGEGGLGPELPDENFTLTGNTLEFNLVIGDVSHNLLIFLDGLTAGSVLDEVKWIPR